MIEKVNPDHPDKIADRIAGALVDYAYFLKDNPRIAVEVLIGHGHCALMIESDIPFGESPHCDEARGIVRRIAGDMETLIVAVPQDPHLADNQSGGFRCGDNGIFRGVPITDEQKRLSAIARSIHVKYPYDGKCVLDGGRLVICQSNAKAKELKKAYPNAEINPLGDWTGGLETDCGAVNRKLGSDMADAVTGGGLHGKDLSKADVSVNIYAYLKAQATGERVELSCAIGDEKVDGKPYSEIVEITRDYIRSVGGFERMARWGLF